MHRADILRFEKGAASWHAESDCMLFEGKGIKTRAYFAITAEALAGLVDPDVVTVDAKIAIEVFAKFEADIYRIAQREYGRRADTGALIMLTREIVAS